ncbi:MAG TPA: YbjQ family protein [Micromonosporaceae bacterium]|nr:YbjQ family protein [Micromonosporaceae bacterium]
MLVVTTETVPGYEIRQVIGEVVGVTARTFNPYIEGVRSLNGKLNPQVVRLLTQIRQEAVARMIDAAERRGANAIIGMRFDHREVTRSWNELCAYGTAVLVVSAEQRQIAAA